jgi:hypothetical protein
MGRSSARRSQGGDDLAGKDVEEISVALYTYIKK